MREGDDEADPELIWALRDAATSGRELSGWALTVAARERAQVLARRRRRRRQAVVGAGAAVGVLFALPVAVSLWEVPSPGQVRLAQQPPTTAAAPAEQAPSPSTAPTPLTGLTVLPDEVVLDTPAVSAVVGGVQSLPGGEASTAGFCRDDAYTGYDSLQVSRSLAWAVGQPSAVQPMGQSVMQNVLVFTGDGAQQWFAQTRAQAADCTTQALEGGAWTVLGEGGADLPGNPGDELAAGELGVDESLVAYSQVQPGSLPLWRSVVTARRGEYVIQVSVETYQVQAVKCVGQAVALAAEGVQRMVAVSGR